MDEVLLEVEPAVVGPHLGPDRLVGHRQDRGPDAECALEREHDRGQGTALADPCRARDMGREVLVPEPEPGLLPVPRQLVHHGPGLVGLAPAALEVEPLGQHVHDRVVVGHHQQAVALGVVAGVDDDGQVARWQDRLEAVGQFRAAGPAGECHDPHGGHASRSSRTSAMRSIVTRSYGAGIRTMTVVKPSLEIRPYRVGHLGRSSRGGDSSSPPCVSIPLWVSSASYRALAAPRSSSSTIGKLIVFSIVVDVATDRGAVLGEDLEPRPDLVDGPARVPAIGPLGHDPERLLRPRATDQDRQVGLDRPRRAQRVVERVEPALVAEPLPVEQPAQEHDRLVEPVEPLARAVEEVDAERVVLALEPRPADAEHGPAVRDVVEGRGDLGQQARVAERVGTDHQAEADPRRQRAERGQHAPALEQRLLPRPEDGHQVVPRPDRIPVGGLGRERGVAHARPVGLLAPELEPEAGRSVGHDPMVRDPVRPSTAPGRGVAGGV